MDKLTNKIKYGIKDTGKIIAQECSEAIFYWLYYSSGPLTPKALCSSPLEEFYSRNSFRKQLDRFYKKGHIRKLKNKNRILFIFARDSRFAFLNDLVGKKSAHFKNKRDIKWRLVIYDVPNSIRRKRDHLRDYLAGLGFGRIQDSCWVSPYDYSAQIADFCREYGMTDYVCAYEGKFFAGKKEEKIVEEAWSLSKLSERYKRLITETESLFRIIETEKVSIAPVYRQYCDLFQIYRGLLIEDPFLPKEFSGLWRLREDAEKKLFKVFNMIAKIPGLRM